MLFLKNVLWMKSARCFLALFQFIILYVSQPAIIKSVLINWKKRLFCNSRRKDKQSIIISYMKKILSSLAALALLFACQPENNPGGTGDNGKDNGGNKEVVATAIKLSSNELAVEKGKESVITVSFTPANVTNKAVTWVSLDEKIATVNDGIVIGVAVGSTEIIAKCGDATDKCKVTVVVSATGVKLDKTSLELTRGDSETLIATVEPEGSTDSVTWETSDNTVATVADGVVTAVGAGEATVTANAGTQKAECKVTVSVIPDGAVDLGIVMTRADGTTYNLYWAKSNLSVNGLCPNPEDYGDYYAWGETEPYYSSQNPLTWKDGKTAGYGWASYKWCNGEYNKLTRYCAENKTNYWDGTGTPDNKTEFSDYNYADDAARAKLGGKWRMPTDAEWKALLDNCTWPWTTQNGVNGRLVTAPNGNSIFLPAAGYRCNTLLYDAGSIGYYRSSSLYSGGPDRAWYIYFNSDLVSRYLNYRYLGFSVRPVTE